MSVVRFIMFCTVHTHVMFGRMTSNDGNSTIVCGGVKQLFSLFPIQSYWYLTYLTHSYNIISES